METNFKVDAPSFALGYSAGKKKGGGTPEGFHMVRFFNDDRTTLLYTVFVPDGAGAIYAGEATTSTVDQSLFFVGFEPNPVNITADMDCYAVYTDIGTLDYTSWEKIARVSADGTAENYFAVGDTKMIHIEGNVGGLEVNGDYGVYILGFNHNESVDGSGITFGTFKSAASKGVDVCLIDGGYGSGYSDGSKFFNMNHWGNSNGGGWSGCDMRYDILGSTDVAPFGYGSTSNREGRDPSANCAINPVANTLMSAMPYDLRAVMKPMTIYSDNRGGGSNTESYVTPTTDYMPLLAEFEILGKTSEANEVEASYQEQYAYFAGGNSNVKYRHSKKESTANWWTRSVVTNSTGSFIEMGSGKNYYGSSTSYGISPIFKV